MNVIQESRCTNCIGHEVQHLTPNGWQACSVSFKTKGEAETRMTEIERAGTEFRVYPTIEQKKV